jgi:DNA-binding Lrp family transcriptional regulator
MSNKARVLLETALSKTRDLFNAVRGVDGVREADGVPGKYVIVAVVEAGSLANIGDLVTKNIHTMPSIQRTTTYLTIPME